MKNLFSRFGVKDVLSHDFRKTRATNLYYNEQAKLVDVQAFLGHKSLVTTQMYIQENKDYVHGLAASYNKKQQEEEKEEEKEEQEEEKKEGEQNYPSI